MRMCLAIASLLLWTGAAFAEQPRLLRGDVDGEPRVMVALGAQVVKVYRSRDFVSMKVLRGHHDNTYVAIEAEDGGPGTCVWEKRLELYLVVDDALTPAGELPLGGYMACDDGVERPCGCGTWESSWTPVVLPDETRIVTESRITHRNAAHGPGIPMGDMTLTL